MGLFDFFRTPKVKSPQAAHSASNRATCAQKTSLAPSVPPAPPLQQFFKVNLQAIPVHLWQKVESKIAPNGNKIERYQTTLDTPDLYEIGNFHLICLSTSNGRPHTLKLSSAINAITPELEALIKFFVERHGEDDLGRGVIGEKDYLAAAEGRLSRLWDALLLRQVKVGPITSMELTIVLAKPI